MPIFRRDPDTPAGTSSPDAAGFSSRRSASEPLETATAPTHIVAGSKVVGEIVGAASVKIDGEVEGRVAIEETVVVGPRGRVRGDLQARVIQLGGRVEGNVRARERVELTPSGSLEGDISAPRVVISEGAFFKGQVEMTGEARNQKPRPEASDETGAGRGSGSRSGTADTPPASSNPKERGSA